MYNLPQLIRRTVRIFLPRSLNNIAFKLAEFICRKYGLLQSNLVVDALSQIFAPNLIFVPVVSLRFCVVIYPARSRTKWQRIQRIACDGSAARNQACPVE